MNDKYEGKQHKIVHIRVRETEQRERVSEAKSTMWFICIHILVLFYACTRDYNKHKQVPLHFRRTSTSTYIILYSMRYMAA